MLRSLRSIPTIGLFSVVAASALSCGQKAPPPPPPPPEVTVLNPIKSEITEYLYYNGTTRGVKETEVRPRVNGYLDKVNFKPDTQVKEGDLLFTIDPRPYKVTVQRGEADLLGKRATVLSAEANLDRIRKMVAQQAASDQERIDRQATHDLALAEVQVAEAVLAEARLNLSFTEVRAPISGRISRNVVDEGTLVKIDDTLLATIVNDEQIYVDFQVSEAEFLAFIRKYPGARTGDPKQMVPVIVELGMADEAGYSRQGKVVSGDNTVDRATATYGVRALFENPDKQIAPGLYVRVRTIMGSSEATLVPDAAVQADQRGEFVLVVGDKNIIERRPVKPGTRAGAYRRIVEGVSTSDRIVVNGLQRARPGAPVTPVEGKAPELPPKPVSTTQPTTAPATQPNSPEGR